MKDFNRRLILKIKGKTPDQLKIILKGFMAHWDDLFDGWSVPVEKGPDLKTVIKDFYPLDHTLKEFNLPIPNKRIASMNSKYIMLLNKITNEEKRLMCDIATYEKHNRRHLGKDTNGRDIIDLPWAMSMYEDEPKQKNKSMTAYLLEMNLHKRLMEIKSLRVEIFQIHRELQSLESKI